jgi:hypothetical protein
METLIEVGRVVAGIAGLLYVSALVWAFVLHPIYHWLTHD